MEFETDCINHINIVVLIEALTSCNGNQCTSISCSSSSSWGSSVGAIVRACDPYRSASSTMENFVDVSCRRYTATPKVEPS